MIKKTLYSSTVIVLLLVILGVVWTNNHVYARGSSSSDTQKENTVVRVMLDWTPNTNYVGLYVAKKQGYFSKRNLSVEILPVGEGETSVSLTVGAGKAEFGYSSQPAVTFARHMGIPIVTVAAVLQHNTSGFAGLKSSGIQTPKDFEGKRYSMYGTDSEKAILDDIMSAFGGDVKKVEIVPFGGDFFQSIQENLFDFRWIYEGWEGVGVREKNIDLFFIPLIEVDTVFDYYAPTIVSSEQYLSENPDVAMRFMSGLRKGYEWSVENPEKSARILYEEEPFLDKNLVLKSMQFLASKFIDDAPIWGIMKQERWENYTKWLQKKGLLRDSFSIEGAFTNEFIIDYRES